MESVINFLGFAVVYLIAAAVVVSWIWALVKIRKLDREQEIMEESRINMEYKIRLLRIGANYLQKQVDDRHGRLDFLTDRTKLALGMAKKAIREQRAAEDQQAFCLNEIHERLDKQNLGQIEERWTRESEWTFDVIRGLESSIEALKKGKANKTSKAAA